MRPNWLSLRAPSIPSGRRGVAFGLWGSCVAMVVASIQKQLDRPVIVVCGHIDEADDLSDDIELFNLARPRVLSTLEIAGNLGRVSEEQASDRMRLVTDYVSKNPPRTLVAPIQSLMQPVPAKDELKHLTRTIGKGDMLEPEKLIVWLADHGYNRIEQCEVPADFAVRGGIIDIYLPGEYEQEQQQVGLTVRVEFFGDQVESIRRFDLDSMGSGEPLQEVKLVDIKGQISLAHSQTHFLHYLDPKTIVVLYQPLEIQEQAKSYLDRIPDQRGIYPLSALLRHMAEFSCLELSQFDMGTSAVPSLVKESKPVHVQLPIKSLQKFETEHKKALTELRELSTSHDVVILCENEAEQKRFNELLETELPGLSKQVQTPLGYMHRGFVYASDGERPLALLGHHELFNRYEQRRRVKRVIAAKPVDSFLDLNQGDYVVHVAHGIAKFIGLQTIVKDGKSDEYLTLRFAENATLHVPAARINLIQKYIGGASGHPTLSRLGSGVWDKQKEKVSEAVMDLAADLIDVQAKRNAEVGHAFPADSEWQVEFEGEFPYTPTVDQVTAADEIKKDMINTRPMDRLLCGDVGYGKTELAMRGAFKCVEAGKQVAVLVPTTVLAEQHYRNFTERFANYPFKIESVSRFRTTAEMKDIIKRLNLGQVDIIVGTHRLLSKDVMFQ